MTDHELARLFDKHVPYDALPRPRPSFVDSPFYGFARELEHRAMATGMMVRMNDPEPPAASQRQPSKKDAGESPTWGGRLWLLVAWTMGKWPG